MLRLMPRPLQFAFQSAGPPPARSLSCRLCRDASSSRPPSPDVGEFIRGAAFPIARAGLRRPLMRSAVECSRPAALFRAPDGLSARPGMSPPRAAGGIPAPATNRPRGACPIGFAGTHRLLSRLLRMSENSSGAPPFRSPVRDCGVRRCAPRPSFARPTDFRHAPACRRPVRRGGHSGSGNEPPAPHSPGGQTPPGAAAATVQLSGSPLPVPMRPVRPKREVRTGAARRFRPNHAVRPPLADVRLFGNGSARNIEGLSNKSRKSEITPVGIHSGRGKIVEIRLVRQLQFAHT